jgi:hypothetical protein
MAPDQIIILVVLLFSVFLGWTLYRGRTAGIQLYLIAAIVAASLLLGSLARALDLRAAADVLIVAAIALSLAVLPAHPGIWEDQIRADLERTRVYQRWRLGDALSWRAWLKLVDRIGARSAALAYLGVFLAVIGAFIATSLDSRAQPGTSDRAAYLFASLPPVLLAVLSTIWIYRSARRLVPGA